VRANAAASSRTTPSPPASAARRRRRDDRAGRAVGRDGLRAEGDDAAVARPAQRAQAFGGGLVHCPRRVDDERALPSPDDDRLQVRGAAPRTRLPSRGTGR
jgi:hypothetical protein